MMRIALPLSARHLYLVLGGLYLVQGVPIYLLSVALPPLLRESGASRTLIGLFSLLMLPMLLKFVVAPWVDRQPLLRRLGHRRGWVVPTQVLTSVSIAAMAFVGPQQPLLLFGLGATIVLLCSLQDIATDGYAARHLTEQTRATGNAIQAGAVALGVIVGGTLTLVLVKHLGWMPAFLTVSALSLLPLVVTYWMRESHSAPTVGRDRPSLGRFFARPDAWVLLGFALTYRASEGLVRGMEGAYLVDKGVPTDWIGYLSGSAAVTAGLLGAVVATLLIKRLGLVVTLVLLGGMRSLCFLVFALNAAELLPGLTAAMSASALQTCIRYMELVAIYTLFMAAASRDQPGTDFTLLTCAELVVYLLGSALAGMLADKAGYVTLFSVATLVSVAGIWLAAVMLRNLQQRQSVGGACAAPA